MLTCAYVLYGEITSACRGIFDVDLRISWYGEIMSACWAVFDVDLRTSRCGEIMSACWAVFDVDLCILPVRGHYVGVLGKF
jgi:hypothetical protein